MQVVKSIEFSILVPFVYSIDNDWIIDFNIVTLEDNNYDTVDFLLTNHKNLYFPILYNNKIEFYLSFDFTDDNTLSITYDEFERKVLDNNELSVVVRDILREKLKGFRKQKLCFCIEYLGEKNWRDCIDIKNLSNKWGTTVAKHKLLYNKFDVDRYTKKVKVTLDNKDYIAYADIGLDLYFSATVHIILTVVDEYEDSKEYNLIKDLYILCTEYTDRYMVTLGNDKNLFGVFNELNLEVLWE